MRALLFLVALMAAMPCVAQQANNFTFTVLPSSPIAGQGFQVRVGLAALSCYRLPPSLPTTDLGNNVIRFDVIVPDSCAAFPQQEATYPVGGLAAGQYTFRYALCPQFVPPIPNSCSTLTEQSVTVGGGASVGSIPTIGVLGEAILIAFMCLLALAARSSMRSSPQV